MVIIVVVLVVIITDKALAEGAVDGGEVGYRTARRLLRLRVNLRLRTEELAHAKLAAVDPVKWGRW